LYIFSLNFTRIPNKELLRQIKRKKSVHSQKTAKKRAGQMKNKPVIVKGKAAKSITK